MADKVIEYMDRFVDCGLMNERERNNAMEILDRFGQDGGLYQFNRATDEHVLTDGNLIPEDYVTVRGGRFLVDHHGMVWKFYGIGSGKAPHLQDGGGAPRRAPKAEMWTGKWAKDGAGKWFKPTIPVSLEANVNAHPGMTNIDWYVNVKGFKHPFDDPQQPSDFQMRVAERRVQPAPKVMAQMKELEEKGLDVALTNKNPFQVPGAGPQKVMAEAESQPENAPPVPRPEDARQPEDPPQAETLTGKDVTENLPETPVKKTAKKRAKKRSSKRSNTDAP